jgi:hypothetical protein
VVSGDGGRSGDSVVDGPRGSRRRCVAAVVSYEHASSLVRAHGESEWTGRLTPLTVDGLIYSSSMAMLDAARRGARSPVLAR